MKIAPVRDLGAQRGDGFGKRRRENLYTKEKDIAD